MLKEYELLDGMSYHFLRETISLSKFWNFLKVRIMKGKVLQSRF